MHTVKITCNTPAARLAGLAPEGPRYNSRVPISFFKCLRNNSDRLNLSKGRGIGQTPRSSPQPEPRSSGQQAQHGQVLVYEGKQYIPLAEVHRFYEAGVRSGAVERIEMLEAQLQRSQDERDELARELQQEHSVHERATKKLLTVALALESELEALMREGGAAVAAAVVDAEACMEEDFAAQLQEMHERDVEAVEESMHERLEGMGHALRTALVGKEQWRHRAMEAEKKLAKLRAEIHTSMDGSKRAQAPKKVQGGVEPLP